MEVEQRTRCENVTSQDLTEPHRTPWSTTAIHLGFQRAGIRDNETIL